METTDGQFGRMRFGAERPKGIHSGIAHDLGIAIVGGVHLPGDVLSGEERFSADNNVSRTAYREAIRILAAKGLVYSRTKSGTRVSPRERWNMLDLDVLAWMFESGPTPQLIRDIFELRRIVEPAAAELAAERRDERELARMGHALEEMAHYGLTDPIGRTADEAFHYLILKATRNEPLMTLSTSVAAAVEWTTAFARQTPHLMRDPMPDHHAVYAALVRRDPEDARSQMAKLVRNASQDAGISDALKVAF
jgi:DNA-binding FadR family transcriptional regulator